MDILEEINFEPNLEEILNFEYILSLEINFLIIIISQLISIIRVMFALGAITCIIMFTLESMAWITLVISKWKCDAIVRNHY